ncbi:hypothetical protein WK23_19965 [Burkholderia vietnamiensis]|nr:hypothetical protein WK23_19965 [Burkholderia vietnamiensis]
MPNRTSDRKRAIILLVPWRVLTFDLSSYTDIHFVVRHLENLVYFRSMEILLVSNAQRQLIFVFFA